MYNQFLLNDFYKITHLLQYRPEITHLTSYLTPRGSRLKGEGIDEVTFFGLSGYITNYVERGFNENFFNRNWNFISHEVTEVLHLGLGYDEELINKTLDKLKRLHDLGYLPVEINAVPEGTSVPMGCPCVEIRSTNEYFPWVGQSLEASLSAAIWHPMLSATIGRVYRNIAEKAFYETVDDAIDPRSAMCDFSMRGQESNESAVASSVGWLTAMSNSSTVMARSYIEENYTDRPTDLVVRGLTSTEHSVMTSHACLDNGDEEPTFKYLFDLYKNVSFAAVCDSYDFWNVLTNILPKFKETIDERGKRGLFIGVRHDSADPVEAVCGVSVYKAKDVDISEAHIIGERFVASKETGRLITSKKIVIDYGDKKEVMIAGQEGHFVTDEPLTWEEKGMVETLWELFGGVINTKGYKVLNPGVKAVYGDSITVHRAREIYSRLKAKGFAANNVSLGVGSFSFQCLESHDGKHLLPFTRDSFSIAIKCTYSKYLDENGEEKERFVFKDPVNFSGKKSQKGLCLVSISADGNLHYRDQLTEKEREDYKLERWEKPAMVNYFINGIQNKFSFNDVRETVYGYLDALEPLNFSKNND